MNFLKKFRWITLLTVLILILTACGQTGDTAPTETPTPTPAEIGSSAGSEVSTIDEPMQSTEPAQSEETASPTETINKVTPTPEGDYDSCLIGTWGIDQEAFAAYLDQAMNQNEAVQFTFSNFQGDFEMVIEPGILSYVSTEPLVIELSMEAGGITLTTLDMVIIGRGSANWITAENYFVLYGQDYDFFGSGLADVINTDLVGQGEVTVMLDPSMFVSMARFDNPSIPAILELHPEIQNYAAATYTCEGDTFTYYFDEYVAVWHRK